MSNTISIVSTAINTERQPLSSRQLTELNKSINSTLSDERNLDSSTNTPAYILDLSDPAINHAANKLQAVNHTQTDMPNETNDITDSPAYILDISNTSMQLAQQQKSAATEQTITKVPETLIAHIQG